VHEEPVTSSQALLVAAAIASCRVEAAGVSGAVPRGAIQHVASLGTPRSVHTVTALPSGQVLVAGGMGAGGASLASVELYDPASNRVELLPPMSRTRMGHTATLLTDGRVLAIGGYNGAYERSVEFFDPATRRFSPAGALHVGRSGHTATLLPDGRVLVIGGVGTGWTFLNSAEIFEPATGRSELVGAMSSPRESHTATLLADGRVLVTGGHSGRRQGMVVYRSAEAFDPSTRTFTAVGALGVARHKHDAVALRDGRVLIVGGADRTDRLYYASTEMYDPRTESFASGPTMAQTRYKIIGTSMLLPDGSVLITSGAKTAELFDPERMAFQAVSGRFPEAYHFAAATALPNGDVIITGGYGTTIDASNGVWRFHQ
jgi:Galactose oxidase, central domain/Kelch motif